MKCQLCAGEFNDVCGEFTKHLVNFHQITRPEYVVITEYNGITPMCECGYCLEDPEYHRRTFRRFARGHNTFKWRNDNYIRIYNPKCVLCGDVVEFSRDKPNKLCRKCIDSEGIGFSSNKIQKAIRKVVNDKYGVNNVMFIDSVKNKHMNSVKLRVKTYERHSPKILKIMSESARNLWGSQEYRARIIPKLTEACRSPKERLRRSEYIVNRIITEEGYLDKLVKRLGGNGRLSKLHIKTRELLKLCEIGFESEQQINRYVVDELHKKSKTIVEINGDYIHANPEIYTDEDIIVTPTGRYSALDKWRYDENRKRFLESLGYTVIVVWERDLKNQSKVDEIKQVIRESVNKAY